MSVSADQNLYRPANLQRAINAVQGKVGASAGLLELSLLAGRADFTLRNGEKAFGYRWDTSAQSLAPLSINVIGSGSLKGQDFPLSQAQPAAMGKIVAALAKQGMTPSMMTLRRKVPAGVLGWAVTAGGGGRTSVSYTADVGGSRVINVEQAAAQHLAVWDLLAARWPVLRLGSQRSQLRLEADELRHAGGLTGILTGTC